MAAITTTTPRVPRVVEAQDSVTRPADTTQYAAGDAISDNATTPTAAGYFAFDVLATQGSVQITDITLHKSDHDVTTATFWLLLFTVAPAFAGWEDNAQLAITDAEMKDCKAVVTFTAAGWANVVTGDIQTYTPSTPIGIVTASGTSTIYGILVAGDTYTPASGEIFTATLHAVVN
jgi:hypothetical protein